MADKEIKKISFDFLKTNQYREIYADGVHGGFTPRGKLQLSFFNERAPIPKHTEHKIENGKVGSEILENRKSRDSIVRNIETTIIVDLDTAKRIHKWLSERLEVAES